jgi:hypothetical protein
MVRAATKSKSSFYSAVVLYGVGSSNIKPQNKAATKKMNLYIVMQVFIFLVWV